MRYREPRHPIEGMARIIMRALNGTKSIKMDIVVEKVCEWCGGGPDMDISNHPLADDIPPYQRPVCQFCNNSGTQQIVMNMTVNSIPGKSEPEPKSKKP
jgi:hypothetical protein